MEEGYVSESTIDNPPTGELEEQEEMFEQDETSVESLLSAGLPGAFKFEMTLKLTAHDESANPKTTTLPVSYGVAPSDRVEECITKQFNSDYLLQRLRAIVGEPSSDYQDELAIKDEREAI
jgi:hypothetical protein